MKVFGIFHENKNNPTKTCHFHSQHVATSLHTYSDSAKHTVLSAYFIQIFIRCMLEDSHTMYNIHIHITQHGTRNSAF